ncbi:hypothetical protein C8R45DRAFT_975887 [Mycena sanguinolenta]|nr:hypothetical protein C8R45DRAFT_975887 [Mycena sanguinolenta]
MTRNKLCPRQPESSFFGRGSSGEEFADSSILAMQTPPQLESGVLKSADSPFVGLFEQNRIPSIEERETIQDMLAEKTAHLARINSQLLEQHKISRELRAELTHTCRWVDFHRALVAPWRQLPVEIISEIFVFSLEARVDTGEDEERWVDDRAGTLLLCNICSIWRSIALGTPALWDTLSISSASLDPGRPLEWVSTWLARSRSSPVHLQLLWDSQASAGIVNQIASVFISHLHHTAELVIDGLCVFGRQIMDDGDEKYPRLTLQQSVDSLNAPLLSNVVVHLPQGSEWDWIHTACHASPCLSHLTTSRPSLDVFPVTNLTELNWIHPVSMSQAFQVFEDAPNLRHVDINVEGPVVPSSNKSRSTMKSLTKVEITSYDHLGEFLEQAEFPSVVDLRVCYADAWPAATFHSFLSRSSCALTALTFHGCIISPTEIVACLQHRACNTLESLCVQECIPGDDDVLLRHLKYQGPEHPPCSHPNLRMIKLHDISSTDGVLAEMVGSRTYTTLASRADLMELVHKMAPARLCEVWFSFVNADTQKEDHQKDWKQLRQIEEMPWSKLKIGWPITDSTE